MHITPTGQGLYTEEMGEEESQNTLKALYYIWRNIYA